MPLDAILRIIELSLQIWLQILKDMPEGEKAKAWERWAKWCDFWEGLVDKLQPKTP